MREQLAKEGEAGEHSAFHRPKRKAKLLGQLPLREATVVRQLEQPPLTAGKAPQSAADATRGITLLRELVRASAGRSVFVGHPAAPFLRPHEIDGATVGDHHDPCANVVTGRESPGRAPDVEEGVLDGVFGEMPIAENAEGEPVGDFPVPVVELTERLFLAECDERDKLLISVVGRRARWHRTEAESGRRWLLHPGLTSRDVAHPTSKGSHVASHQHTTSELTAERAVPDERALLKRLRSHDERAFADLVDAHSSWMLRTARVFVRSRAVAEEVVQETWLNALRALNGFEGRSTFRTWLFAILRNTAKRHAAREDRSASFSDLAREAQAHEPEPLGARFFDGAHPRWPHSWTSVMPAWDRLPEESLLSRELRTTIEAAVETLPDGQRTVFSLRDLEQWTAEEVCNALAISDSNQRVLLHRARLNMRAALERYFNGERT